MAEEERKETMIFAHLYGYSERGLLWKYMRMKISRNRTLTGLRADRIEELIDDFSKSKVYIPSQPQMLPLKKDPEPEKAKPVPNQEPTEEIKKLRKQTASLRRWLKKKGRKQ
ncbi:MAG: hypothetical protein WC471_03075 [Candidatus Woesearchaeota archaeon]